VRRHAVREGLQVLRVGGRVLAARADGRQVVRVPVQALAARYQLLAAEKQVEAVGPASVAGLRVGVEGPLAHRVALDGDELAAVGLGRPPADGTLVRGRQVGLVRRRARDRKRLAEVNHRDLRRDLGDLHLQSLDGGRRLVPQRRRHPG